MSTLLKKKVETFLTYAEASSGKATEELVHFFENFPTNSYAVVNGNISLFVGHDIRKIIELPKERTDRSDAFLFDGFDISIMNSSDSSDPEKKKNSSSGSSFSNNNNNNNNNG